MTSTLESEAAVHSVPMRWLAPSTSVRRRAQLERGGARCWPLRRRGAHCGYALAPRSAAHEASWPAPAVFDARWRACEPIVLRGALRAALPKQRAAIASSLRLFESVRAGGGLQEFALERACRTRGFEPAGTAIDLSDRREIEKVFVNARRSGRIVARDLYAKLSWIAHDPSDLSLRIRFSFGAEALLEWIGDARRAVWSDAFAERCFPECALLSRHARLARALGRVLGQPARLSERIVYSNAPGGGAIFHHDDEPHQRGVVYGQLAGATLWFALPKRRLAPLVAEWLREHAPRSALARRARDAELALRALEAEDDAPLARLLNETPSFARLLVERGDCLVLQRGDALLLPSHGPDDACWHSVYAQGERASLAHSYGIFARA